jgi:uncharacterized damage-inducible protein DinB
MKQSNTQTIEAPQDLVITPELFLEHWQGHRRVTRRVIEAFPEDKLFSFSIGGMRPAYQLIREIIGMSTGGIRGIATRKWEKPKEGITVQDLAPKANSKKELLDHWDNATEEINTFWKQIAPHRFMEQEKVFQQYEGPLYSLIFYIIDNEIHHRGQMYVYLRSLGIEPPAFPDRS